MGGVGREKTSITKNHLRDRLAFSPQKVIGVKSTSIFTQKLFSKSTSEFPAMILDLKMDHQLYTVNICYYTPSNAIILLQSTLKLGCGLFLSSEMGPFKSLLMAEKRKDQILY